MKKILLATMFTCCLLSPKVCNTHPIGIEPAIENLATGLAYVVYGATVIVAVPVVFCGFFGFVACLWGMRDDKND